MGIIMSTSRLTVNKGGGGHSAPRMACAEHLGITRNDQSYHKNPPTARFSATLSSILTTYVPYVENRNPDKSWRHSMSVGCYSKVLDSMYCA